MDLANPTVTAATISTIGAVVSAIFSFVVSWSIANSTRLQLQQRFNEQLYRRRLECYPGLYEALGAIGKRLRMADLKVGEFVSGLRAIEDWDNKYAVYVSASVVDLLLNVRNTLASFDSRAGSEFPTDQDRQRVFDALLRLEQALKYELGVYSIRDYHNPRLSIFLGRLQSGRPD